MTNQLSFNNTILTPIIQDNQIWLSAKELSKALEYKSTNAVTKIFNRNEDEFTELMTLLPNLGTKGFGSGSSVKATRIFSLRGCHLIAMFSRTEVAKEFRKWALDILDKESHCNQIKNVKSDAGYQRGISRILMTFENGLLIESHSVANDQGVVSFSSPKILKEMIRDAMPGYVLINKKELTKAFGL